MVQVSPPGLSTGTTEWMGLAVRLGYAHPVRLTIYCAALGALFGCNAIFGTDDFTYRSTSSSSGSGGGGTGGATTTSSTTVSSGGAGGTSTSSGGCPHGGMLDQPCTAVALGSLACDTCAQTNCCVEIEGCSAEPDCAGLMYCLFDTCAGAPDPQACIETSCPDCLTQTGADLYNAWAACLSNTCANECGT